MDAAADSLRDDSVVQLIDVVKIADDAVDLFQRSQPGQGLEDAVLDLLVARGETLSVAESMTGGALAARLEPSARLRALLERASVSANFYNMTE